jgi:hypothetical protein
LEVVPVTAVTIVIPRKVEEVNDCKLDVVAGETSRLEEEDVDIVALPDTGGPDSSRLRRDEEEEFRREEEEELRLDVGTLDEDALALPDTLCRVACAA